MALSESRRQQENCLFSGRNYLITWLPSSVGQKKKNPKTQKLCAKKPFMLIIGQPAVSRTMVLEFEWASESPGGFVKAQMVPPFPWVSDSVGSGWYLIIYVSDRFPGGADALVWGITFWDWCSLLMVIRSASLGVLRPFHPDPAKV